VGILVMISRFGGLIRDSIMAYLLGGGWVADAYATALKIPNMLRDLLGEGALSSVVVARLGAIKEDRARVKSLVRQLMGFWMIGLGLVACAGVLGAPILVKVIAYGFDREDQIQLAIHLTRIIFPYVAIIGLAALSMGVLHHLKVFGWSSSASAFANLSMIILLLIGVYKFNDNVQTTSTWIACSVVISGLVQWASLWPGFRGSGISLIPSFKFSDSEIAKVFSLLGPSVLSVAAVQINVAVNHGFATSLGEGAASSVYYAFRLMSLPVGIVGVAVSTVLLPTLTDFVREKRKEDFRLELGQALVSGSFLSFPALAGLAVLGPNLVSMLYERGQFGAHNTEMVWLALQGFLLGILPSVYNKSLVQGYFAHSDTKLPLRISLLSIGVNGGLNAYMVYGLQMGVRGLMIGTSCVLLCNALMLVLGLQIKHKCAMPWKKMIGPLLMMALLSFLMYGLLQMMMSYYPAKHLMTVVYTAIGGAIYLGTWWAVKKLFRWDFRKLLA
jgi:putative peptidoglycan lipid II flippase